MRGIKITLAAAAAAGVALFAGAGVAAAAPAGVHPNTFGCATANPSSLVAACGTLVAPGEDPNLGWNVKYGTAKYNQPVIAYNSKSSTWNEDAASDFILRLTDGAQNFGFTGTVEYAPNGDASGFCVSAPDPVKGGKLVLRPCKENEFQTFDAVNFNINDQYNHNGVFELTPEGASTNNLVVTIPTVNNGQSQQLTIQFAGSFNATNQIWGVQTEDGNFGIGGPHNN